MAQVLEFPYQRIRFDGECYQAVILKMPRKNVQFDELFYWMMFPWSVFGFTAPEQSR